MLLFSPFSVITIYTESNFKKFKTKICKLFFLGLCIIPRSNFSKFFILNHPTKHYRMDKKPSHATVPLRPDGLECCVQEPGGHLFWLQEVTRLMQVINHSVCPSPTPFQTGYIPLPPFKSVLIQPFLRRCYTRADGLKDD